MDARHPDYMRKLKNKTLVRGCEIIFLEMGNYNNNLKKNAIIFG
jgi:hypothetical protein